jgi:hypothetical protein
MSRKRVLRDKLPHYYFPQAFFPKDEDREGLVIFKAPPAPDPYTVERAESDGYTVGTEKWDWSKEEVASLEGIMQEMNKKPEMVHLKCPFTWISRNHFFGKIKKGAIKKKFLEIERKRLEKVEEEKSR